VKDLSIRFVQFWAVSNQEPQPVIASRDKQILAVTPQVSQNINRFNLGRTRVYLDLGQRRFARSPGLGVENHRREAVTVRVARDRQRRHTAAQNDQPAWHSR
jgi:hypothetical protein